MKCLILEYKFTTFKEFVRSNESILMAMNLDIESKIK